MLHVTSWDLAAWDMVDPKKGSLSGYWLFAVQRSLWMNMLREKKIDEPNMRMWKHFHSKPTFFTLWRQNFLKFLSDIMFHFAWPKTKYTKSTVHIKVRKTHGRFNMVLMLIIAKSYHSDDYGITSYPQLHSAPGPRPCSRSQVAHPWQAGRGAMVVCDEDRNAVFFKGFNEGRTMYVKPIGILESGEHGILIGRVWELMKT